jgi:1,2-dihydroxy-3-keto-5-methylthiopentene dioxygenase
MHAYYFDNEPTDQRLPHSYEPPRPVSLEKLESIGVLHWHIPISESNDNWECEINKVAKERGYKNRDIINVSRQGLGGAYEEKIKGFFRE